MARTALSRLTTYSTLTTNVRAEGRITTTGYSLMTDAYVRSLALMSVQRWARVLADNAKPFYRDKESLTLIGIESPYYVDTSALSPYWGGFVRLVHVTSGGTRTAINVLFPKTAEDIALLSSTGSNAITAVFLGWGFRIFFGSGITVTPASDTIEFTFDSQAIPTNSTGAYLDVPDSIVPYVKEEIVDYLKKYKGLMDGATLESRKSERYKKALASV